MPELTTWLMARGISEDLLFVLVAIPVLVTLTSISRYITGIKTFGVYASMILALAFYFMGMVQGFMITLVVVLSSLLTRNLLRGIRLHYLARLAIVYCGNVLFILAFIVATSYLPTTNPYFDFRYLTPLPLAMIITVTDRFVASYIKKDLMTAARLVGETLIIAIIGWGIIRWDYTHDFLMNNLWIIPALIIVNILVGQYSGFRWMEFIRFSQVLQHVEPPGDNTEE